MIPYILHVALLLAVCLLFYKVLLQKETFYRLNRSVLVFCLALSFALPLVPVPQQWALRETAPATEPSISLQQNIVAKKLAYIKLSAVAKASYPPVAKKVEPITTTTPLAVRALQWLVLIYWIGVCVFGLNLLLQVVVLLFKAYTRPVMKDGRYRIIELTGDKAPCSFGNNIFINPGKYDWDTYSQILLHEKIHIQQGHSFDILMAELVLVLQWFNPFAWLYRTEVENNLEFLTDESVLEHKDIDKPAYQMSLLKVSVPHLSLGITTNYNQSLLKRRILMMNAKRSNIHTMWKYFFLVPLLGILACGLNDPAVYGQPNRNIAAKAKDSRPLNGARHDTTNAEGSWFATIKGDIVKMEFKNNAEGKDWSNNAEFSLSEFSALPRGVKGDFSLKRDAGNILFNGKFDGNQGYGHYKFTPDAGFNAYLSEHGFKGIEAGDKFAFFMLDVKKSYVQMLENSGFKNLTKDELISMTALKVDADYIAYWKKIGYNLTPDELVSGKALGINSEYVDEIRKAGYKDITYNQLVSFKATGVAGKYIEGLHGADDKPAKNGEPIAKLSADDVVSVKAMNVDDAFVSGIQKEGFSNVSLEELTSMKAVGVTPEYINGIKAAGYGNVTTDQLISLKSLGITPEYAKSFESVGIGKISVDELTSVKALGITPEYIRSFKDIGFKNISVDNASSLKALGVTAGFINGFKKIGFPNISLDDATSLKATGVTPEYITEMKGKGFKSDDVNKYIELKNAFGK